MVVQGARSVTVEALDHYSTVIVTDEQVKVYRRQSCARLQ